MRHRPARRQQDPFAPDARGRRHMLTTEIQLEVDADPAAARRPLPASVQRAAPRRQGRGAQAGARKQAPRPRQRRRAAHAVALLAIGAGAPSRWAPAATSAGTGGKARRRASDRLAPGCTRQRSCWPTTRRATGSRRPPRRSAIARRRQATTSRRSRWWPRPTSPPPSTRARRRPSRIEEGDKALEQLRASPAQGPARRQGRGAARASSAPTSPRRSSAREAQGQLARRRRPPLPRLGAGRPGAARRRPSPPSRAALARAKPRIPALYGLGLSQLELGDRDERAQGRSRPSSTSSRDRFKRDHLGALIGLAQLAPVGERESRYQELLDRPDLAKEPPRAVSRLKPLAGDEALRAGRLDQARGALRGGARARSAQPARAGRVWPWSRREPAIWPARASGLEEVLAVAPDHIEGALALGRGGHGRGEAATRRSSWPTGCSRASRRSPTRPCSAARTWPGRARLRGERRSRRCRSKAEAEYREAMKRADPGDFAAAVGLSIAPDQARQGQGGGRGARAGQGGGARRTPTWRSRWAAPTWPPATAAAAAEAFRSALARRPDDARGPLPARSARSSCQGKSRTGDRVPARRAIDKDSVARGHRPGLARMLGGARPGEATPPVFRQCSAASASRR